MKEILMLLLSSRHSMFLFLSFWISSISFAQESFEWGLHGKSNHLSSIEEVAIADNGDAIFVGGHDSLITIDQFSFRGPKPTGSTGATRSSVFVGLCKPNKEVVWAKSFAVGSGGLYVSDMEMDSQGNIWVCGSAEGTIDFSNGNREVLSGMGYLLLKISPNGNLIWGRTYSGLGSHVHYYQVLPRDDGKCYILANHGAGNFGASKIPAGGENQYSQYIGLVDETGNPVWGKSIGGPGSKVGASDFTFDEEGHLIVGGFYRYLNIENVFLEGDKQGANSTPIQTQMAAGDVGAQVTTASSNGGILPMIGRYHKDTGAPIEIRAFQDCSVGHVTAVTVDQDGSIYAAIDVDGQLKVSGQSVKSPGRSTMAIIKFNKDWSLAWHKAIPAGSSTYADDFCIDGDNLYAACMISSGRFEVDDVSFTTKGLWSGAVLKFNKNSGWCASSAHWEVGRSRCVAVKNGTGYTGGWFHYDIQIANDRMSTPSDGQFNAVLARIGPWEEQKTPMTPIASNGPKLLKEPLLKRGIEGRHSVPFPTEPDISDHRREARSSETQHRLEVRAEKVTIKIWDNRQVDGDVISLRYNGEWILEDYRLRRKPHVVQLAIAPDHPNFIEMYSEDVGSIPPTTTQIAIDDGTKIQSISLRSTPETNGVIEIFWME